MGILERTGYMEVNGITLTAGIDASCRMAFYVVTKSEYYLVKLITATVDEME